MKKLNKLVSVMLALVMAIGMTTTAMATEIEVGDVIEMPAAFADMVEGECDIVIENAEPNHTYVAYQIFDGKVDAEKQEMTGTVAWGSGVDSEVMLAALKNVEAFAGCKTASDVASVLSGLDTEALDDFTDIAHDSRRGEYYYESTFNSEEQQYTIKSVPSGYYLIVDVRCIEGDVMAFSDMILYMTDGDPINPKADYPVVDKTVEELDYDMGETVTFTLTGSIPDISAYDSYIYTFHDTLSEGLTLVDGSFTVYAKMNGELEILEQTTPVDKFTFTNYSIDTAVEDGCTFELALNDLKTVMDYNNLDGATDIVVTYDAVVNGDAVVGNPGNPNEVYLQYSNNPQYTGDTTTTPVDMVKVYTFQIDVDKVDQDGVALAGAKFVLKNAEGAYYAYNNGKVEWVEETAATVLTSDDKGDLSFVGLDAGTYTLVETAAPEGYNGAEAKEITIAPSYIDTDADGSMELVDLPGGSAATGAITVNVANVKNSINIPETGGMGTTLFYAIGGMLTVGAAAVYVTRKRMGDAE